MAWPVSVGQAQQLANVSCTAGRNSVAPLHRGSHVDSDKICEDRRVYFLGKGLGSVAKIGGSQR
ncbi:hypothetical protein GCM10010922_28330 [Microbacterium sorbitolivorans]|nr:hypothetical protein GCM10010922_28330 [Microbacterium sorbitolivorans]